MAKKMKIRAFSQDNGEAIVKALMFHPMETGLRKDKETGKTIPAHHITEVQVEHNGKKIITCLWGTAVSKNPYLSFDLKGAKPGDEVKVSWVDNLGKSETGGTKIR
jgi:sulfur-oxidizing protein SoxZ